MFSLLAVLFASVVSLAFVVVIYVVNALGILRLMEAEGLGDTYRAWIPIWNSFVLGEILEEETEGFQLTFPSTTKWIVAAAPLMSLVPGIGSFCSFLAGIYIIVLCAKMASKLGTQVSMIVSSIFLLQGIGLMIYASKLKAVNPGKKMEEKPAFSEAAPKGEVKTVDFTVEAADSKSAPAPGPVYAKPEGNKGTVIAKPENSKGIVTAKPEDKAGTIDAVPEGKSTVSDSLGAVDAGGSGEVREFDVPLADDSQNVEFDVTGE